MLAARLFFKTSNRLLLRRQFARVVLDSSTSHVSKISDMELSEKTKEVLIERGYTDLFPIQYLTYKDIEAGRDLIAKDKTGSGKTLAYALPLMEKLRRQMEERGDEETSRKPKVLVMIPTRELAIQVSSEFEKLVHSSKDPMIAAFYGGTSIVSQFKAIKQGIDILVATPGRLLDHIERNSIDLSAIETVVLDETDEMLEIGFKDAIFSILKQIKTQSSRTEKKVQFLLFSATVPKWVQETANQFMEKNYKFVDMVRSEEVATPKNIKHILLKADYQKEVIDSLSSLVDTYAGINGKAIIFTNTKREADNIVRGRYIRTHTKALHGDVEQAERELIFRQFKEGNLHCLVATNVAARGVDFPKVDLVIQVNPPNDAESFIHRSGRTGRAGKHGTSVLIYDETGARLVKELERVSKVKFERLSMSDLSHMKKKASDTFRKFVMASLRDITEEQLDECQNVVSELVNEHGELEALKRLTAYFVMNPAERGSLKEESKYGRRNEDETQRHWKNDRSEEESNHRPRRSSDRYEEESNHRSRRTDRNETAFADHEKRPFERTIGRSFVPSGEQSSGPVNLTDCIFISNIESKEQLKELEESLKQEGIDLKVSRFKEPTQEKGGFAFASVDSEEDLKKVVSKKMIVVDGHPIYMRKKVN